MLSNIKQRKQAGFTIIEVMIVLAIAAMILLVVLLAVPALQRNSRNTALKTDASAIAGGISEFASNNDGALPDGSSACAAGSVTLQKGASGSTVSKPRIQGGTAVTCTTTVPGGAVTPTAGTINVYFGATCPDTTTGNTVTVTASARATAIVYANEATGGTLQAKCLAS